VTALRNIGAVLQKEWRHYFGSPIAYVTLFVWTLLFGVFFALAFFRFQILSERSGAAEFGPKLSLNEMVIALVLQNMAVVALLVLPLVTMRLFAEEKRQGTLELLATNPLTSAQIVLGKFCGALALYTLMLLCGLLVFVPLWAYATTPPEWKPVATGALSLLLLGGTFIALGTFISTLTRSQIVAAVLTFGVSLTFWVASWMDDPTAGPLTKVIVYLGMLSHVEDLMRGVIDLKDIVYYLSFITFGLFLTHQSLESQRWRA
jgi:ABC-2 type transport system permease protein